jgi:hypothetical protein
MSHTGKRQGQIDYKAVQNNSNCRLKPLGYLIWCFFPRHLLQMRLQLPCALPEHDAFPGGLVACGLGDLAECPFSEVPGTQVRYQKPFKGFKGSTNGFSC